MGVRPDPEGPLPPGQSFVSDYLGKGQTAVQLHAILHALAQGRWSQVVATTAFIRAGGPPGVLERLHPRRAPGTRAVPGALKPQAR
jgi:hypothetical protein